MTITATVPTIIIPRMPRPPAASPTGTFRPLSWLEGRLELLLDVVS